MQQQREQKPSVAADDGGALYHPHAMPLYAFVCSLRFDADVSNGTHASLAISRGMCTSLACWARTGGLEREALVVLGLVICLAESPKASNTFACT